METQDKPFKARRWWAPSFESLPYVADMPKRWVSDTLCLVKAKEGCTQLVLCLGKGLETAWCTLVQGGVVV